MPRFVPIEELFKGRHFDPEIVVLCVRWYLSCKWSYRDLVAMMGERGTAVHTTILRWVQHDTADFEKRGNRYARWVGGSWRCDDLPPGEGGLDVSVPSRGQGWGRPWISM